MDCIPDIPNADYRRFSKRLHNAVIRYRVPVGGSIDVTSRCNLRCVHCYVRNTVDGDELTTSEIIRILDEAAEAGCLWMMLSGGEPLLRPDLQEIYLHAKKKGFLINLFTNATLMTPEFADMLDEWRPFAIEVTLYGATKETYEQVTQVSGSYERCLRGIDLLRARNIPFRLKSMVLTVNQHELGAMFELAGQYGVEFRYDANIHKKLDGSCEPCKYRLTPQEVVGLDFVDNRRIKDLKALCDYSSTIEIDQKQIFHCSAGLTSFHIDSTGMLVPCLLARGRGFDLKQASFAEGWNNFIPKIRFQEPPEDYKCTKCRLYRLCGQCPGWGEVENGKAEIPSEFLCELAHLRAEHYGSDIYGK
ncbi:MAG: radical SAM protein [Thermoleophilia bacterium]